MTIHGPALLIAYSLPHNVEIDPVRPPNRWALSRPASVDPTRAGRSSIGGRLAQPPGR